MRDVARAVVRTMVRAVVRIVVRTVVRALVHTIHERGYSLGTFLQLRIVCNVWGPNISQVQQFSKSPKHCIHYAV